MMLEQDVMIPFQTAWTRMADGSAEQMYVEQGVPHVLKAPVHLRSFTLTDTSVPNYRRHA